VLYEDIPSTEASTKCKIKNQIC